MFHDTNGANSRLKFWEAVKIYRKAVFWSMMVSMAIVMDGYDGQILGQFYALAAFRQKYVGWLEYF